MVEEAFVLLVEDDPDDQFFLHRSCAKAHVTAELVTVDDGQQALDLIGPAGKVPRLVLLDVHLPFVDGDAVLEALRSHPPTKDVPVIVLTSSAEDVARFRARDLPRITFLSKPLAPAALVAAMAELGVRDLVWRAAS